MGLLVLGLLAGFGLGTVVSQTRWLYESVRWAGVALLLWLAWDSYREARRPIVTEAASRNPWGDFGRGLATNLLNPKAAMFYVAVLPNFVASDYPVGRQSLILTLIYVGIATLIHAAIVLAASTLQPLLSSAMVRRRTGIVFALLLAAIAGWVAITTHRSW